MTTSFFLSLAVGLGLVAVAAAVVVGLIVLVVVMRPPVPRVYGLAVRPTFSTPLERARAAASVLTLEDWEAFRCWVDKARPSAVPTSNGVVR